MTSTSPFRGSSRHPASWFGTLGRTPRLLNAGGSQRPTNAVVAMDLHPGGAFVTLMSENGRPFTPHVSACFVDVAPGERIVFTNALTVGWRPATSFYPAPLTAVLSSTDHPDGTNYVCDVMHGNSADCRKHEELGFFEGWGTVIAQLAAVVEAQAVVNTWR